MADWKENFQSFGDSSDEEDSLHKEASQEISQFVTDKMEKLGVEDLKIGQLAEFRTFEEGYRGAWFRCKIRDIVLETNRIKPEYYDFPDEEITMANIYELPNYGSESTQIEEQLMVRPQYPQMYHKNEMPAVNSISEVCVIINGAWKVGDLVDWHTDDCYWSARVVKVLNDDKVQIELPKDPVGQGGVHEALCKDLRPSLDWSPTQGWTLPTMNGQTSCSAQLIFPSQQDMDLERDEVASPQNASSTSHVSVISSVVPIEEPLQSQEVKTDVDEVEKASSSDSISTMKVEESKTDDSTWDDVGYNNIDLNIMHEETLEASILDLEELANRVKWLQSILDNNQSKLGSWKFELQSSSNPLV